MCNSFVCIELQQAHCVELQDKCHMGFREPQGVLARLKQVLREVGAIAIQEGTYYQEAPQFQLEFLHVHDHDLLQ
jgi:hypothetical protein